MASPIRNWLRCSPLGSGSFSSVSLALNLDDGLLFAVKSVHSPSPPAHLRALHNELLILQSLHSQRIISCLGSDRSSENEIDSHNLFLEYMHGGSIAAHVQKSGGKLDEARVRIFTREILEGLSYLHEQGIVHCDIKGQNILLGSSGIKIADFGAAKRVQEGGCEAAIFQGTPLWMAPEVVQGVEQGLASDVWSLGCTVVEMLQGRTPWTNTNNLAAVLFQIGCSQEDAPLPECVSAEATDFLRKCLQRDPRARWTAAQLLDHPFVKAQTAGDCDSPRHHLSPRSAFDFSSDESDSEDDSKTNSVPIVSLPMRIARSDESMPRTSSREEANIPNRGEWVTVRGAEAWSDDRQQPFMLTESLGAGERNLVTRKGSEVNMDCARFLRNRKCPK